MVILLPETQVLKGCEQPLERSLPDAVLATASAILAPESGLADKPRYSAHFRTTLSSSYNVNLVLLS